MAHRCHGVGKRKLLRLLGLGVLGFSRSHLEQIDWGGNDYENHDDGAANVVDGYKS